MNYSLVPILSICLAASSSLYGADTVALQWQQLISDGKYREAKTACTKWLRTRDNAHKVEAYKCLANVELCSTASLRLEGNDAGGGFIGPGYDPEAAERALVYLNKALVLAPQDASIHAGRLHVYHLTNRIDGMAAALEESCRTYKGRDALDTWIQYTVEFFEEKQFKASLKLLAVLDKYYPDSHDVLGNTGATYMALGQFSEALPFLQEAVQLAPEDPIDNWNVGRVNDYLDKVEEAARWYQRALHLNWNQDDLKRNSCLYARFVEKKLKDSDRACPLQRQNCAQDEQTACKAAQ